MNVKSILNKYIINPDVQKDQFFLKDDKILDQIVEFADLNKSDKVLEIGAGIGNLTERLAEKAKKVFTFEIDERFQPILDSLPKNVEVTYDNAWKHVQMGGKYHHKKFYNKVVSNLPYSFVEPFLHNLTFVEYDKVIIMVPIKMVNSIKENGVFQSFFEPKILLKVSKTKFYPVPKTDSVVIELIKLPDPIKEKNLGKFLRQQMYKHEDQKVKNSVMHALINYAKLINNQTLTKNEAREIIKNSGIPQKYLDQTPNTSKIYDLVEEKIIL